MSFYKLLFLKDSKIITAGPNNIIILNDTN